MRTKSTIIILFICIKIMAQKSHNDSIIISNSAKQTIEINYSNLSFTNTYKSWQSAFIQYAYKKNKSTIIPRLNIASRYNIIGTQIELDEYQKFKNKFYVYFNYAFSNSILFPQHRYGIELYKDFNKGNEISFGIKQMFFKENKNAIFYTASYSKYLKNNLFSYRIFLVPKINSISSTHIISIRHYLKKEEEFLGVSLGIGFAQPENTNSNVAIFSSDPAFFLRNQRISFSLQKYVTKSILIKPSIDFNRQELSILPNQFQLLYLLNFSIAKKI